MLACDRGLVTPRCGQAIEGSWIFAAVADSRCSSPVGARPNSANTAPSTAQLQDNTDRPIARMREIVPGANRSAKPIGLRHARAIRHPTVLPHTPSREEPPRMLSREGLLIDPRIAHEQALVAASAEALDSPPGEAAVVSEEGGSAADARDGPTCGSSTTLFFSANSTTALASIASPITVATGSTWA